MSDRTPGAADRSPLFTFVVVADTHVNEGERTSTSPYETNHLANPRARHVFAETAAMDPPPRFVVHLGDIVHPVPSLPAFHDAVAHFKSIASQLPMPLHLIPGNHDVGDKTVDWMPAEQVCDAFLATYREAFGTDFHAFDEDGVRFVMLNSLLLNSGLDDEARQREWLERQIDTAGHRRVFLFMHYPPYIYRPDEAGNYDNVDEPARTWLLGQIARPEVEAVFAGHVHNFWYDRAGDAEMYLLPSTSFLRHDFSEFCSVPPAADTEFGRDDSAKFGWFRVDVMGHGHVAYAVRSHGRQCAPDETPDVSPRRHLAHPKTSGFDNVGVELRHPWAEVRQITAPGGVQEFGRKRARNAGAGRGRPRSSHRPRGVGAGDARGARERHVRWRRRPACRDGPASLRRVRPRGACPMPGCECSEIRSGQIIEGNGWTVRAVAVPHVQPYLDCFGFRLDAGGRSFVYSGDCGPCNAMKKLAAGADVMVHMTHYLSGTEPTRAFAKGVAGHMEVAEVGQAAGVGDLVISHVLKQMDKHGLREKVLRDMGEVYKGNLIFGEDLMEIPLDDPRVTTREL